MKKVFLTGNREPEWRWDVSDFLIQREVTVFDPADTFPDASSIFKYLKVLESCDLLIAYLAGIEQHPLAAMLEMSYASKLAKDVVVVDDIPSQRSWLHFTPYSMSFSDLDNLKPI
jgi:IS5 family transposase